MTKLTKAIIKAYIDEAGIKNYSINQDLSVNFNGDAVFDSRLCKTLKKDIVANLGIFPFKIVLADGNLVIARMFLISLLNMPPKVRGTFDVSTNKLRNLIHCPSQIDGDFICKGNKDLIDLEHGPIEVGNDYDASYCGLHNVHGLPHKINGDLRLSNNQLRSLPHNVEIEGNCYLSDNTFIE